MISNKNIIDGVKEALARAFRSWLDENRDEIVRLVASAVTAPARAERPPEANEPAGDVGRFLTTEQLARRWSFHPETIRQLSREDAFPVVRLGRRIRVPIRAVEDYEAGLGARRRAPR